MVNELPEIASIGRVRLKRIPESKSPEHYAWKKALETEWAGAWTLASLTNYRYKMGLDPAFAVELAQVKKGKTLIALAPRM